MSTMTPSTMAKRVLISALFGVLAGAFPIFPVDLALYQHYVIHNEYWFSIGLLEATKISLARAPGMAIFGLLFTSPLITIAVATGVLCRRKIDRHPLLWASVAPVLVWLFTCSVFALQQYVGSINQHSYGYHLINALWSIDNSLYFFSPAAAALCFMVLTCRAARHT